MDHPDKMKDLSKIGTFKTCNFLCRNEIIILSQAALISKKAEMTGSSFQRARWISDTKMLTLSFHF